jgi:hypothetical protein
VGDPSTGYLYKTTISDLKTLTGAGVVSFNGRIGSVVPAEGDYTLTQLSDVIITSASNNQVLRYNGSNWVNATIDLSGYVPYTGATGNVNLGSNTLLAAQIKATSSAGLSINANSGTQIADLGAGGGANMTLFGGLTGTSASFSSSVTGNTIVKTGGTSSQFLKADGSVDSSTYLTTSSAASTYVPYTGATTNVDLGSNDFLARYVNSHFTFIEGDGTQGGILSFKQYALSYQTTTNHTNIYAIANSKINFSFYQTDGSFKLFNFDVSSLGTTNRTYTMPDASGTIALTSQLHDAVTIGTANGLSLSGQVLSLALASTSATGALSSTDWNTFNGKQAAGNYVTTDTTQTISGAKTFSAIPVIDNGSAGMGLRFKMYSSSSFGLNGYMDIAPINNTGIVGFAFGISSTVTKIAYFSAAGLTDNTAREYTLPDASGTLALTSNLSAYLPLTGGTLSAGVIITNANDTYSTPASTNVPFIYLNNSGTTATANSVIALRTNGATGGDPFISWDINGVLGWSAGIDNSDGDKFKISKSWASVDTNTYFTIDTSGNSTFAGTINATNFSGSSSGTNTGDQDLTGYVPTSRTLTINGTAFDLSANRSWTVTGTDATKLPLTGGTLTNTGGNQSPILSFASSGTSAFQWITQAFNASMGAGNAMVHFIGQAASNKNSGYFGFNWAADQSDSNYLTLGFFNNDHLFRLYANGNLGIGVTSNAGYKLDVKGSSRIIGLQQDAIQTIFTLYGYNAANQDKALYFRLTGSTPVWTLTTGSVGTDAGINILPNGSSGLSLAYSGAATFSSNITAAGATFSGTTALASAAGTSQMRIDRSGTVARIQNYDTGQAANISLAYDGGNVGINTANPSVKLQVTSAVDGVTPAIEALVSGNGRFQRALRVTNSAMTGGTDLMLSMGKAESTKNMGQFYFYWAGDSSNSNRASIGLFGVDDAFNVMATANILVGTVSENGYGSARSIQIDGSGGSLVETRYSGTSGLRIGSGSDHSYHHDPRNAEMRFATSDSTRFIIYGNGNYSFTGSNVSDRRAKDNISNLEINATDKIMLLKSKIYNMKNNPSQKRYGFIAQDVREILSDLVNGNDTNGYLGLDYDGILTLAIKALQEQQIEIQNLKQKVYEN